MAARERFEAVFLDAVGGHELLGARSPVIPGAELDAFVPREHHARTRARHEVFHDLDHDERADQHQDHYDHVARKVLGVVSLAGIETQRAQSDADYGADAHTNHLGELGTDHPAEAVANREDCPRDESAEKRREQHAQNGTGDAQSRRFLAGKGALHEHAQKEAAGVGERKEPQG